MQGFMSFTVKCVEMENEWKYGKNDLLSIIIFVNP